MPEPYSIEPITLDELPEGDFGGIIEGSSILKFLEEGNIVDKLEDNADTATEILELYEYAKSSMEPWEKKYKRALNLAKLQAMSGDTEINEKNFPFEGASLVMMPYILEAMLDFSSRASGELVWANDIIHAQVYGENKKEKEDRAKRVADYSNYQLRELIPNWREDQDKGLMILASPGTFYKKTYYDYDIQEACSELCLADEIIFNHDYKSFECAPDKFQRCTYTRNDIVGFIRGAQKWNLELDELDEEEETFEFIEAYTWLDLDNDGLKEPYIAVIWEEMNRVVCLYPCFDEDTMTYNEDGEVIKILPIEYFTQYRFLPDPEGGPMGLGWGILLGPMFDSINTNMRQLIDAGTLSNASANSGLISQSLATGRGNAVQSGPIEVELGSLTPVPNHGGGNLRDNIMQFPFAGPNPTLFALLQYLIDSSRSMTNSAIAVEAQPGEAAALYLARLRQGLKIPNSIIMRVYESAKKEFQKIAALNYRHYDDRKYNKVLDLDQKASMKDDFNPDDCDIRMVADPTQGSDIERVQRAQAVYEMSAEDPQINRREALLSLLETMNTPELEALVPEPDPEAKDPMQEMMIAQQMADMEMRKQDQELRSMEIQLKQQKQAMEAAKEMTKLGLDADKQEAEITALYSKSLKDIVDAGIATGQGIDVIQQIEDRFIKGESVTEFEFDPSTGDMVQLNG
jgi:hypothetical protein